jgi:glycosyltransferase involved in cell wall biosynthesis
MRLLIASGQWFPDYAGGTARVVRATAEGLVRKGHEVVVIAPGRPQESAVSLVNGVELRRVLRRGLLPLAIADIYEIHRAIRTLEHRRFDAILAHGDICAAGALSLRRRPPLGLVFHASGSRESQYRRSGRLSAFDRSRALALEPLLRILERFALRHAERVLVLSEFSRDLVLDSGYANESRIDVVGGGVDTDTFTPARHRGGLRQRLGIESDQPVLMTARRLVSRMGIEMLLDAFGQLRPRFKNAQLVIAGDGELRSRLEARRDELGLSGSVRFLGRISDADLRDWYRASDVFVLPTVAYEGFGMVTAEALACGTPVVGTRVGATSELLAGLDDRFLVPTPDASSLASTIAWALANAGPALRSRCRTHAMDRLAWERVLGRWEASLSSMVGKPAIAEPVGESSPSYLHARSLSS